MGSEQKGDKESDEQSEFERFFGEAYKSKATDFDVNVHIAIVGKVSAGKSSLLNAILGCDRSNPTATVGVKSGITTKVTPYQLDKHVLIIDCPGLDDVRKENSDQTKHFLSEIDLGLFVVTGSSDASQKSNYEDLKRSSKKTIVILNKIDEWKDIDGGYEEVLAQWKADLGAEKIFATCTKGYDPKFRKDAPMDLSGVNEVREEIFDFLEKEGKAILLARHLKNRGNYAIAIISTALIAVGAEAFIPGSAAYITATQVVAITSLQYLYTGITPSKKSVFGLLPAFIGESVGMNLFLFVKSFIPPTGILDVVAAGVAVLVTFAMLATVKWMLKQGFSLEETERLKTAFNKYKSLGAQFSKMSRSDLRDKNSVSNLIRRLLSGS
ncbi:GTPase [Bdellovibrionota bacterium FG-2]